VSLLNAPGPNTWPITLITYIWAAVDMTGAGYKGPLLKAFLSYLLSAEGQAAVRRRNVCVGPCVWWSRCVVVPV
jgi:hypothetical protein